MITFLLVNLLSIFNLCCTLLPFINTDNIITLVLSVFYPIIDTTGGQTSAKGLKSQRVRYIKILRIIRLCHGLNCTRIWILTQFSYLINIDFILLLLFYLIYYLFLTKFIICFGS